MARAAGFRSGRPHQPGVHRDIRVIRQQAQRERQATPLQPTRRDAPRRRRPSEPGSRHEPGPRAPWQIPPCKLAEIAEWIGAAEVVPVDEHESIVSDDEVRAVGVAMTRHEGAVRHVRRRRDDAGERVAVRVPEVEPCRSIRELAHPARGEPAARRGSSRSGPFAYCATRRATSAAWFASHSRVAVSPSRCSWTTKGRPLAVPAARTRGPTPSASSLVATSRLAPTRTTAVPGPVASRARPVDPPSGETAHAPPPSRRPSSAPIDAPTCVRTREGSVASGTSGRRSR